MSDTSNDRGPIDQGMAQQVVNESMDLGLSADDLGINREDVFADLDLENDPALGHNDFDDLSVDGNQQQQQPNQNQNRQQPNQNNQQQPNQQQNFQQQDPNQNRPLPQYALVKPDAKGNLVDTNGQIIARAGGEARHYQKFARHFEAPLRAAAQRIAQGGQQNQTLQGNLDQAIQIGEQLVNRVRELSANQQNGNMEREFGLTRDELIQAATFARQAKSDPASAIKSVLTLAAARGIDIKTVLGPNAAGGGIDTKAILDLIKGEIATAVKPINERTATETQREQQQQQFNQAVTQIQNEARQFFERTPDAVPYLEAFRQIKTDPNLRHLGMDHIWSEIQLRLARGGFTPQTYMQRTRQQNSNGMTMPSGRSRGTYTPPDSQQRDNGMAPVSTSYDDIVRDLLRST